MFAWSRNISYLCALLLQLLLEIFIYDSLFFFTVRIILKGRDLLEGVRLRLALLTHFILRDELHDEAHVVERTFIRIVRDDSRRFRREFRGHRRCESIAFPKMRHSSTVDD